ncbi:DUF4177 domain-containing protein [Pseudooceanicola sp. CBS1P-1]|uniref:DUF4177 domain-containing protein n=1 Tax=Pseudooceanicola albus TaxID=2692189 RepID=A0A6L7FZB9_9RHOB|nr:MULTISPECIES: DUF4177 domain-containing protein [Pseudooceanicola]MBT9382564.1 DUF4177 domain-containing protein [Pseudooceanicola endophyticus]MXN17105.1 DUF4177 domain-containing protein [Pseudooceanicola albus]
MTRYEYKVVPAPVKAGRAKGVKGGEARFANALEELMNELAAEGWEYQRAETLPQEERSGLTGSSTTYRNLLVFRRALSGSPAPGPQRAPQLQTAPAPAAPAAAQQGSGAPTLTATRGEERPDPETPRPQGLRAER